MWILMQHVGDAESLHLYPAATQGVARPSLDPETVNNPAQKNPRRSF